jgi:predicted nucleic acid-binding protein
MDAYFDTSILLKSFVPEEGTPEVLEILRKHGGPFPFSHLLELELRTALRMKHGRGEITAGELRGALQALEKDLASGVLVRPDYDLAEVFRRAESLSAKHAVSTLARSADLWHVAAALQAGCTFFASRDARQRQVAGLCGLVLIPSDATKPPRTGKRGDRRTKS